MLAIKSAARLLYFHPSPLRAAAPVALSEAEARQGFLTETTYDLAGWKWTVVARPVNSQLTTNGDTAAWGVWAVTMLFTMLVLQYMISSQTRTQTIERSVTQRTAELSAANEALETQIQERLRVEQALRAAKEQAEVANRAKSEFLAMMSHELRTPLNAVIGFAELLARESLGPIGNKDYVDYAEDIRLSGTHLLSLINDILDLSKIEANRFELNEDVIDVADTLRSVLPILQEKISQGMGQYEQANLHPNVSTSEPSRLCLRTRLAGRAWQSSVDFLLGVSSNWNPKAGCGNSSRSPTKRWMPVSTNSVATPLCSVRA